MADQGSQSGQELCTLHDGRTVVAVFDGFELSTDQPSEIAETIETLVLTDDLRNEISRLSPHIRLINQRVQEKIAERYTISDEIKLLRTSPIEEMLAYNTYAEECRAWGRGEKAKLGL